jgi:hypothetical protein
MLIASEVIWILTLLVIVFVITPLVLTLCWRLVSGARDVHHHFAGTLEAAVGVVENTSHVKALQDTIGVAGGMLDTAGRLDQHSAAIENLLIGRLKAGS